jgi:hypothetical protein
MSNTEALMLFKRNLLMKIVSGEKTATRRPTERKRGRRVYEVGEKVGIRNGYDKPKAYIIITRRYRQKIGDTTDEDAKKEGFKDLEEFKRIWRRFYGNWTPNRIVWVYEFKLATED